VSWLGCSRALLQGSGLDEGELAELEDARKAAGQLLDQLWDLTDRDNDFEFYRLTFTGKEHWNFLSTGGDVPSIGVGQSSRTRFFSRFVPGSDGGFDYSHGRLLHGAGADDDGM
jgi:hypothetical protein